MFEEERHEQIVQLLKGGRMVSVGEIAKQLFVSEATVRRDLTALERAGVLRRVYGGAVLTGANRGTGGQAAYWPHRRRIGA